jgi:hypothetical protein
MSRAHKSAKQGFVLITMAAVAAGLIGAMGLAIDMGRLFIAKNETQAYCDAGSLAAALQLDGTSAGITRATAAAESVGNTWNMDTANISTVSVDFAPAQSGPWSTSPSAPAGYIYARVRASVQVPLYFLSVVNKQYTQEVDSLAKSAQIAITYFPAGLSPYTAVSTNTTGPNFGLTVGSSYDMQWPQYNSTRNGCSPTTPDKCFNAPTCSGDTAAAKAAVVGNWGSNDNGYWGFSDNADIAASVLDLKQLEAVSVGTNLFPVLSNGNKAVEAQILDQRASEDQNVASTVPDYLAGTNHNGMRTMAVPIVDPTSPTTTTVMGYGLFLLYTNGTTTDPTSNYYAKTTNGNDPFCAIYMGPYTVGASNAGGATSGTGGYRVKLVQ